MSIDSDFTPVVKVNGSTVTNYTADFVAGKIVFEAAPPAPDSAGRDNVSVEFKKTVPTYKESRY
jgi:hypothetical protein